MTSKFSLEPHLHRVYDSVGLTAHDVDVDAIHDVAGAIARAGLRPIAPVGGYLWGAAIGQHPQADRAELQQALLDVVPSTPLDSEQAEDPAQWHAFAQRACDALGLDVDDVPVDELPGIGRHIAHASVRPMAPVATYLLGLAHTRSGDSLTDLLERIMRALEQATDA